MPRIVLLKGDRPAGESEAFTTYQGLKELSKDDFVLVEYRALDFVVTPEQMTITYRDEQGAVHDLAGCDLVYIRDFHGYEYERNTVALYLRHRGVRFLNTDVGVFQCISKLTQYAQFFVHGIAFPPSVFAPTERLQQVAEENFAYPMVVKAIAASGGRDNYLISDAADWTRLRDQLLDGKYLVQPFVPNDGDYRLIVLGKTVSCISHRQRQGDDHRNNIAQGGAKHYLAVRDFDPAHIAMAVAAAQALRREICGVDLMIDKVTNQAFILEANFNFGIKAIDDQPPRELQGLASYLHDQASGT